MNSLMTGEEFFNRLSDDELANLIYYLSDEREVNNDKQLEELLNGARIIGVRYIRNPESLPYNCDVLVLLLEKNGRRYIVSIRSWDKEGYSSGLEIKHI